jgi:hypothetical protein
MSGSIGPLKGLGRAKSSWYYWLDIIAATRRRETELYVFALLGSKGVSHFGSMRRVPWGMICLKFLKRKRLLLLLPLMEKIFL